MLRKPRQLVPALLLGLAPAVAPAPVSGQGRWMDIGSGASYTIAAENDPESFERFPPFAFGPGYAPGNLLYAELVPWPCSSLPPSPICGSGRFVAAFNAYLEIYCSCTGALFEPVELELHYDPARVAALGAREADLRLALYDQETGDWVELGRQRAVPERDVVTGSHTAHARQFYTILVRPGSGDGSSWGRIKSLWRDAR